MRPLSSRSLIQGGRALIVVCALVLPALSVAHRLPECVTTLRYDIDASRLEVEHRLHRHDGLRLLALQGPLPNSASLDQLELRARVALAVEAGFRVRSSSAISADSRKALAGDTLPGVLALELVGAEVEGDYVYVYQQHEGPLPPSLALRHEVLNVLAGKLSVEVFLEQPLGRQRIAISRDTGWTALPSQFLLGAQAVEP